MKEICDIIIKQVFRFLEPIAGVFTTIGTAASNTDVITSVNQQDWTMIGFAFYITVGFLGAAGAFLFKALVRSVAKRVKCLSKIL